MTRCEYCGADFPTKADKELHIEHDHPLLAKERGLFGYFDALNVRYSSKKRAINR